MQNIDADTMKKKKYFYDDYGQGVFGDTERILPAVFEEKSTSMV